MIECLDVLSFILELTSHPTISSVGIELWVVLYHDLLCIVPFDLYSLTVMNSPHANAAGI